MLHFFVVLLKLVSWPKCTWGPGACGAFPQKLCNFSLLKSFCWVLITVQIFWYFSPENGSHKEVNACFFGNFHLLFLNFSMFWRKRSKLLLLDYQPVVCSVLEMTGCFPCQDETTAITWRSVDIPATEEVFCPEDSYGLGLD